MRRAIFAAVVTAVGLVLLLSFKPHDLAVAEPRSANAGPWTGDGASLGDDTGTMVDGDVTDTRWGPVQVRIVLSAGKLTGVQVLQAPAGTSMDVAINDRALPILDREALTAQSARIDTVSGATYTSDGYVRSLQSALDRAGL
ncbi:FMN-binding protein [Planotetraspora mira]|uniref:FMN-binding protein n=1 Tax=Planotetraspora mira TaxID=58121 RepID=A0A8J3X8V1_9ACTN|nr:FMN-binding protein [Planotetraspora mira]GII32210.1 FMN-binding protein [Planotetraspora mira]